eukprot:GFYU01002818.1.p1 GENE.GFYU01002818.1~~GFYU01002818.1.p1  ORF type:complete len:519 (-),score=171.59 GFYU01002818.1:109-1665(-)
MFRFAFSVLFAVLVARVVGEDIFVSDLDLTLQSDELKQAAITKIVSTSETRGFIDEHGRQRFFHGMNVVQKGTPFHPLTDKFDPVYSFSQKDIDLLADLGLNVIRLGMMWAGVEPTRGKYDDDYLKLMRQITDDSAKKGIYTLLDMHQDLLSEKFCGEGVPLWAAEPIVSKLAPFPMPVQMHGFKLDENGVPPADVCKSIQGSWGNYHFAYATSTAYQALYSNQDGLRDAWAHFWKRVAEEYKTSDAVLGYELINEPWAGNIYHDPTLLVPGVADKKNLQPAYEHLQSVLREGDPDAIVFFASVTWDNLGVGFTDSPGGADYKNKTVFAYHWYNPPNFKQEEHFKAKRNDMKKLGVAGMVTEFGVASSFDEEKDVHSSMRKTMDVADDYLQSWITWEYKEYTGKTGYSQSLWSINGTFNEALARVISRTYPQAIAGTAQSFKFVEETSAFELQYLIKSDATMPTEIFVHQEYHYPNGMTVTLEPANVATYEVKGRIVVIHHNSGVVDGTPLNVTIEHK